MTKDSVLARKETLTQQREQLVANLNALAGALQDCDYWIARFEEEEKKSEAVPVEAVPVS